MFNRLPFPATAFFLAAVLGLLQIYYALGGGMPLAYGAVVFGLLAGIGIQACFHEP